LIIERLGRSFLLKRLCGGSCDNNAYKGLLSFSFNSMPATDLMTSKRPDSALRLRVVSKIGEQKPYQCYQCIRCTSGCPSMKMLELKPHEIVALTRAGFIDQLLDSGIVWACATCLKCKERCPQAVAPVDLIMALRNLAVEKEVKVPESFLQDISMILECGLVSRPQQTVTRKLEKTDRGKLGLPMIREPDAKFKAAFMKALETFSETGEKS
jgi:heterodisulfide reductase subunit C